MRQSATGTATCSCDSSTIDGIMATKLPANYLDLFQKKAFGSLATLMPDGSPQVTPVWCDFDGTHIVVNSAKGRLKDRNIRRDGRVALMLMDPDNPYRYLEIRGRVVDITEQGGDAHIDKMAQKYLGQPAYPWRNPKETRVLYKIEPLATSSMG